MNFEDWEIPLLRESEYQNHPTLGLLLLRPDLTKKNAVIVMSEIRKLSGKDYESISSAFDKNYENGAEGNKFPASVLQKIANGKTDISIDRLLKLIAFAKLEGWLGPETASICQRYDWYSSDFKNDFYYSGKELDRIRSDENRELGQSGRELVKVVMRLKKWGFTSQDILYIAIIVCAKIDKKFEKVLDGFVIVDAELNYEIIKKNKNIRFGNFDVISYLTISVTASPVEEEIELSAPKIVRDINSEKKFISEFGSAIFLLIKSVNNLMKFDSNHLHIYRRILQIVDFRNIEFEVKKGGVVNLDAIPFYLKKEKRDGAISVTWKFDVDENVIVSNLIGNGLEANKYAADIKPDEIAELLKNIEYVAKIKPNEEVEFVKKIEVKDKETIELYPDLENEEYPPIRRRVKKREYDPIVVSAVITYATEFPQNGPKIACADLRSRGLTVSQVDVRTIWIDHNLEIKEKRILARDKIDLRSKT